MLEWNFVHNGVTLLLPISLLVMFYHKIYTTTTTASENNNNNGNNNNDRNTHRRTTTRETETERERITSSLLNVSIYSALLSPTVYYIVYIIAYSHSDSRVSFIRPPSHPLGSPLPFVSIYDLYSDIGLSVCMYNRT